MEFQAKGLIYIKIHVVEYMPRQIIILLQQNYVRHCPVYITFNIGGFRIGSYFRVNNYNTD